MSTMLDWSITTHKEVPMRVSNKQMIRCLALALLALPVLAIPTVASAELALPVLAGLAGASGDAVSYPPSMILVTAVSCPKDMILVNKQCVPRSCSPACTSGCSPPTPDCGAP